VAKNITPAFLVEGECEWEAARLTNNGNGGRDEPP
jgi:hypothetical protein